MNYLSGQFVFLQFESDVVSSEKHPFSLASTPNDRELSIVVKALGDYTSKLPNLAVGTKVKIEGPYGNFVYYKTFRPNNKKQIWVAGGSGIAPLLGMARDLASRTISSADYDVDLYYTVRGKADLAFSDELEAIAKKLPNFRLIPFVSEEQGYLNVETIMKTSEGIAGKEVFICGPPPMMAGLKKQFADIDIPRYSVHTEEFKLL